MSAVEAERQRRIRRYRHGAYEVEFDPFGDESGNATLLVTLPLKPLSDLTLDLRISWFRNAWERWPDNRRIRVGSCSVGYELHPPAVPLPIDDIPF